jgi:glucosylglycerate phosphorylase
LQSPRRTHRRVGPRSRGLEPSAVERLREHAAALYGAEASEDVAAALAERVERFRADHPREPLPPPAQDDVVLITYPDQVREPGRAPLVSLREVVTQHLGDLVSAVHLLPVHPWTSDDGFAVADYATVDPRAGDWSDVEAFRPGLGLMLDAVVNHVSASHPWARGWRAGEEAYDGFIRTEDPAADLSEVVRPRALPLLTPVETVRGTECVWTTFSADQHDLDFRTPAVLLAVTDVLLDYLGHGATMLRLDAIAFLWKEVGTACIHHPRTHEVVRLWRTVVDLVAPGTLIVTETNVPHRENLSYLGMGADEAHLVYQFPLAPLVLSAFTAGDVTCLRGWAQDLEALRPGTSVLNVLGSHDGIGLRPAQGLLTPPEIARLVDRVRAHGGAVSFRALPDGGVSPYELNTVYFDALNAPDEDLDVAVARQRAAHAVVLALAGVPALYVHALLGSRNWHDGPAQTGAPRSINRRKLDRAELEAELRDPTSLRSRVLAALGELIRIRRAEPAFHPAGAQHVLAAPDAVLAIERRAPDGSAVVVALHNAATSSVEVRLRSQGVPAGAEGADLVSGAPVAVGADGLLATTLPPLAVAWLRFPR